MLLNENPSTKHSMMAQLRASVRSLRHKFRSDSSFTGYLFIAPAVIFLALMIAYPLLSTLRMSLFDVDFRSKTSTFVGLHFYGEVLTDSIFWSSLKNTVLYTFGSVVLHVLLGGGLALLLNERWAPMQIRNVFRGLFIIPWLFSVAASALIWALLYQPVGPLNHLLVTFGVAQEPIDFLGNRNIALWALVFVNVWKYFPFHLIVILGNLQTIPLDLYEAAWVDGANRLRRFRHITLPMMRPSLVALIAIDIISTFGVFDIVKLMTNGGPYRSTQTVAYYLWQVGLRDVNFGFGSAISIIMLVFSAVITLTFLRLALPRDKADDSRTTAI